jgi:hypothetical protein
MSLSSFSLILGVYFYVFGFPLVFSDEKHLSWVKKFLKDENMLRLAAIAVISVAVTTLRRQWVISPDGEGVIIAIAWIVLLKGLVMAWWPATIIRVKGRMIESLMDSQGLQSFAGFVMVLLGALFTYLGLILA